MTDQETHFLAKAEGTAATSLAPVERALEEIRDKFSRGEAPVAAPARGGITAIKHFPAREARLAPFPEFLPTRLTDILRARGIESL